MKELEVKVNELKTKVSEEVFTLLKRISALETINRWYEYRDYISFNNRGDICYNNKKELTTKLKGQFNSFEDFYNHLNEERLNDFIIELNYYLDSK